jgi:SNF2 family DNA or RNA helicase
VEQQAIDRVYRIGQDKNVFAYRMICKDTIEEKIIKLQQSKMSLSEELISEDDGFVKNLSENDLQFLFE